MFNCLNKWHQYLCLIGLIKGNLFYQPLNSLLCYYLETEQLPISASFCFQNVFKHIIERSHRTSSKHICIYITVCINRFSLGWKILTTHHIVDYEIIMHIKDLFIQYWYSCMGFVTILNNWWFSKSPLSNIFNSLCSPNYTKCYSTRIPNRKR